MDKEHKEPCFGFAPENSVNTDCVVRLFKREPYSVEPEGCLTFAGRLWYDTPMVSRVETEVDWLKGVLGGSPDLFMTFTFPHPVSPEEGDDRIVKHLHAISRRKFYANEGRTKVNGFKQHLAYVIYGGPQDKRSFGCSSKNHYHAHVLARLVEEGRPRWLDKKMIKSAFRDHRHRVEARNKARREGLGSLSVVERRLFSSRRVKLDGHPIEVKWKGDLDVRPAAAGHYRYLVEKHLFRTTGVACSGMCRGACKYSRLEDLPERL